MPSAASWERKPYSGEIMYGAADKSLFAGVELMIAVQLIVYLLVFTLMVKIAVRDNALNGIYFYPREVQKRAVEIGLIDEITIRKKRKHFMIAFYIVMAALLLGIIGLWNRASDFKSAYLQAVLFLEVMNWYDGFIIDEIWVRFSKFWVIPGLEDMDYVQSWTQMFRKRLVLTAIWLVGAAIIAALVVGIRSAVC